MTTFAHPKSRTSPAERYRSAKASHVVSQYAQQARRRRLAVEEIAARVAERWPSPTEQRRALERWSGVLRANDPGLADALLDVPVAAGRKVA